MYNYIYFNSDSKAFSHSHTSQPLSQCFSCTPTGTNCCREQDDMSSKAWQATSLQSMFTLLLLHWILLLHWHFQTITPESGYNWEPPNWLGRMRYWFIKDLFFYLQEYPTAFTVTVHMHTIYKAQCKILLTACLYSIKTFCLLFLS